MSPYLRLRRLIRNVPLSSSYLRRLLRNVPLSSLGMSPYLRLIFVCATRTCRSKFALTIPSGGSWSAREGDGQDHLVVRSDMKDAHALLITCCVLGLCGCSTTSWRDRQQVSTSARNVVDIRILAGVQVSENAVVGFTLRVSRLGFFDSLGHRVYESDIASYLRCLPAKNESGEAVFNLVTEDRETVAELTDSIRLLEAVISNQSVTHAPIRINVLLGNLGRTTGTFLSQPIRLRV